MNTPDTQFETNTSQAWDKLRSRLEHDGLLNTEMQTKTRPVLLPQMKWAASLLVLAVTAGMLYYLFGKNEQKMAMFNDSPEITLVGLMPDGTTVYLNGNSGIEYNEEYGKETRTIRLNGEAYFRVTSDARLPFIVNTRELSVRVTGTSFHVKQAGNGRTELYVDEGSVEVSAGRRSSHMLDVSKGELLVFDAGEMTRFSKPGLETSSWKNQRIHFRDETLGDIFSVINSQFGWSLSAANDQIASRRLTVTFFNNDLSSVVELIRLSMNLEPEYRENTAIVFNHH